MLPRSLTARLMLAAMAGVLAAAAVGSAVIWVSFWPGSPGRMLRAELEEEVGDIREGLRRDPGGELRVVLSRDNTSIYDAMPKDTAYLVTDASGRPLARSIEGPALERLRTMRSDERTGQIASEAGPVSVQLIERTVEFDGADYRVRVARSDRLVTALKNHSGELYLRATLIAILLALGMFTLVVYLTIRRMVRPLREASGVAARLEPRNLSGRLRTQGMPAEIVPLIDTLNAALARLETGFRVQQQFLASAAHELKTPLALLQAEIELGGAADTPALLRDTALMGRIVHQLLHLAEASEGHNYRFESVDLRAELEAAAAYLERLADQRGVVLRWDGAAEVAVRVEADRGALFVLTKNLLENAIHHAPPGSAIGIHIGADGFSVEDAGPGVAAQDVPFLFQRFWRARADAGDGAGLGLAICREICQAHRWQIDCAGPAAAGGARFVVHMRPEPAG